MSLFCEFEPLAASVRSANIAAHASFPMLQYNRESGHLCRTPRNWVRLLKVLGQNQPSQQERQWPPNKPDLKGYFEKMQVDCFNLSETTSLKTSMSSIVKG